MATAYEMGRDRGAATGRREPTEADFAWLAARGVWSLDGSSDPQVGVDFEAGMAEGAGDGEEEVE